MTSLLTCIAQGEAAMQTFVQDRLITKSVKFHDTMKKLRLKTFASMAVHKELTSTKQKSSFNSAKCCEMIVYLPLPAADSRKVALPPPRSDVTRVDNITVLGVTFNSMLSFAPHVQKVASKAAASLYALRMLKAHGLDGQALWEVTQATLVAQP